MSAFKRLGSGKKKTVPTSTPERTVDPTMMHCDVSTIRQHRITTHSSAARSNNVASVQSSSQPDDQQLEMTFAYNDYLLAKASNLLLDRNKQQTERETEEQLRGMKEQQQTERESQDRSMKRLQEIQLLTTQSVLLDQLEAKLVHDIECVAPITSTLECLSAAVEPKMNNLRVRTATVADVKPGIGELVSCLSEAEVAWNDITEVAAGHQQTVDVVRTLKAASDTLIDARTKQHRMQQALPKLQALCIEEAAVRGVQTAARIL